MSLRDDFKVDGGFGGSPSGVEEPMSDSAAREGEKGEACHKCVSIHRVEISEVWDGNLEPVKSWRQLRGPRRRSVPEALRLRVLG